MVELEATANGANSAEGFATIVMLLITYCTFKKKINDILYL